MPPRDPCRLGITVAPKAGESGMSLVLRAFQANVVDYEAGMRWLGLDRRQALGDRDIAALAWALQVDIDDLRRRLVLLERCDGGRWVHLADQRLSRWIAPTCMTAKVCPECLRESGFARMVWVTRAAPACSRHGYSLLRKCPSCKRVIKWARPAVRVCQCGRYFKNLADVPPLEPEIVPWLKWTEAVFASDSVAAQAALRDLPPLLQGMSLDGAYRMVEAFGLLESPGGSIRTVRHSSVGLIDTGAALARGLNRIAAFDGPDDIDRLAFGLVYLPVLRELADTPAIDADGRRAAWLLDVYRASRPSGASRAGTRPRRQLPLFL